MTWEPKSETTRERLRALWLQVPQLSTAAIGREMGISKNAIVGLAHRIDLPGRPSPIKPNADGTPRVIKEYVRKTPALPPLASAEPIVVAPVVPVAPTRAIKPVFVAPPPKPATPMPYRRISQCSYVTNIGRFGVGVTYCDEPTARGPYCQHHGDLCLVRVRPQTEPAPLEKPA